MPRPRFVMPHYRAPSGYLGLSVSDIPDACLSDPEFVADFQGYGAALAEEANRKVDEAIAAGVCSADERAACYEAIYRPLFDELVSSLISEHGCKPKPGQACDSYESKVEAQLGLRSLNWYAGEATGTWDAASQAALLASGYTFQQMVPGCTGPAPTVVGGGAGGGGGGGGAGGGGGGGGGGGVTTVGYGDDGGSEEKTSPWIWVGLGAVAVVGLGVLIGTSK